ncbi:hypothetical protein [Candidatus Chloroploca mongolica]|nr:hypothetical protein [Candidatus Chloroploca mongolica]
MSEQLDRLQALLAPPALGASMFPPNSRYAGIATATLVQDDGRPVVYLRRRFVPAPERLGLLGEHLVVQGERLDQIAAQELGDAEGFWRVCDANRALRPSDLMAEIGRRLRITLPEGMPGGDNA